MSNDVESVPDAKIVQSFSIKYEDIVKKYWGNSGLDHTAILMWLNKTETY